MLPYLQAVAASTKDLGIYDRDELDAVRDLVEERILEVKKASFDDEYHQIIGDRIAQKISDLNPNDAYYHENARELLYLIDYYDLDINLRERMREEYIEKYDPNGFIIGTEAKTIYDLFCRDAKNPANEFESIAARIIAKFPQRKTEEQQQLEYSFNQYTKGLDPNSSLIIDYLNSSYSKDGWANIDKEIGSFAEIINDPSRPNHERVDAEGYYAICKFKIAGHLHGLKPNARRQELERLVPVLTEHFGLSGDVSFEQVLEHTESYARGIMAKQQGEFKTAAEAGRLCQVAAVVMQMPRIGGKCDDFADMAVTHFNAAKACADMGSSRGCTYLSTAYDWLQNPNIPYKDAVEHLVDPKGQDFVEFCQAKEQEYTKKSAELGSISAIGSLGKEAKKAGRLEEAAINLKIAADGGLNRYQYLLGELYLEQGRNSEADHYLGLARENGFDVDKSLQEKGMIKPIMAGRNDTISSILKKGEVKEDLSNIDQVDVSGASDSTKRSWVKFVERTKSKEHDQGHHK